MSKEVTHVTRIRKWIPVVGAAAVVAGVGGMALAATTSSGPLLQSQLFGNMPKVTIRGVASATAPWVLDGKVTLTRTHLSASGKWMLIPAGYMASGAAVPKSLVGTTAGVPKLVAEITDANGGHMVTAPVVLTKKGSFTFNMALHLTGPIQDPIVLIGPPGKKPHTMLAWFAASNFLRQYGYATPAMVKSWAKASAGGTTKGSYGGTTKKSGSGSGSSGW
jgi:hypothetical protein